MRPFEWSFKLSSGCLNAGVPEQMALHGLCSAYGHKLIVVAQKETVIVLINATDCRAVVISSRMQRNRSLTSFRISMQLFYF